MYRVYHNGKMINEFTNETAALEAVDLITDGFPQDRTLVLNHSVPGEDKHEIKMMIWADSKHMIQEVIIIDC